MTDSNRTVFTTSFETYPTHGLEQRYDVAARPGRPGRGEGRGTEPACPRRTFTEQVSQVPAEVRITERLRSAAGRRVCDAGSTVVQTARDLGVSWPAVMDAFRTAGQEVTAAALGPVEVLGIDETRRGTGGDERVAVMKEPAGLVRRQCGEFGCQRSAARRW
ncbi:helix-turn-helix domain-containing protein [Streptomyces sp. NPDC000994]